MIHWKEILDNANSLNCRFFNIRQLKRRLYDLDSDLALDIYDDTQPGGGSFESQNRKKYEEITKELDEIYDIRSIFSIELSEEDLKLLEFFDEETNRLNRNRYYIENDELMDEFFQASNYYRKYEDNVVTKESIVDFCEQGRRIVKEKVAYDEENERFYLKDDDLEPEELER